VGAVSVIAISLPSVVRPQGRRSTEFRRACRRRSDSGQGLRMGTMRGRANLREPLKGSRRPGWPAAEAGTQTFATEHGPATICTGAQVGLLVCCSRGGGRARDERSGRTGGARARLAGDAVARAVARRRGRLNWLCEGQKHSTEPGIAPLFRRRCLQPAGRAEGPDCIQCPPNCTSAGANARTFPCQDAACAPPVGVRGPCQTSSSQAERLRRRFAPPSSATSLLERAGASRRACSLEERGPSCASWPSSPSRPQTSLTVGHGGPGRASR
jgi:hypothetical protein